MAICLSHAGGTIYSSEAPSRELLVGTVDGVVFVTREKGDTWQVSRKALEGRHVVALLIEPTSGTIFATMHNGGVAASEDAGKSWEFRNQGLISENVYCIACSVVGNRPKLYVGTEPAHLFVSTDRAATWQEISSLRSAPSVEKWTFPVPPHHAHVKDIAIDPTNPEVLYVCVEQGGLFKSVDGGSTWKELHGSLHNDDCHRLLIFPSDPRKMLLPTGYGFYWSTNGGETWKNIGKRVPRLIYPDPLVINPRNENLVFMSGAGAGPHTWLQTKSANPKIARSRDGGETWEVMNRGLPDRMDASIEAMTLEAWEHSCGVYAGNTAGEIYYSGDEGESWTKIIEGIPPVSKTIHHAILHSDSKTEQDDRVVKGISRDSRYQYE